WAGRRPITTPLLLLGDQQSLVREYFPAPGLTYLFMPDPPATYVPAWLSLQVYPERKKSETTNPCL
ncbi:MAG: hypothetical protein ACFFCZ_25385, partial [Promethearchaeota archaeon]